MKKSMVVAAIFGTIFLAGVALADQLTIVSYEGAQEWRGQLNFTTAPQAMFSWGYCTEQYIHSNAGQPYEYVLRDLAGYFGGTPNYGFNAAELIWREYHDGSVTAQQKTDLQFNIWKLLDNADYYDQISSSRNYTDAELENLFSIAYVANSNGWGQDFIVYHPVPEPATMLLLGFILIGIAITHRIFHFSR